MGNERDIGSLNHSRRKFIGASAIAATGGMWSTMPSLAASTYKRIIGANDRIRIGLIGCGNRGATAHMNPLHRYQKAENLELVAVCDPWRVAREEAAEKAKGLFGTKPAICRNYRELLELKDLDAVMIASPDHVHTLHLEAAAKAGKHAYAEKPLGINQEQLVRAVDAVKESGIIVQVGTQHRSRPPLAGCREFLKTGLLGRILRVEQVRNGGKPYWYQNINPDVRKEDLDWDEFTNGVTDVPFDSIRYSAWYGYYEFSQGPVPQWGSHFIDIVHYMTGLTLPETCVTLGGLYMWKDDHNFTAPDQVQAVWNYPEDIMVSYSTTFGNDSGNGSRILGDKGTLTFGKKADAIYSAVGGVHRDGSIRGENIVPPAKVTNHFENWFQCMRTGETPRASIDDGYRHSVASIMSAKSYETGRRTRYNPDSRTITLD
jgi:predicted dehydrogenase